MNSDDLEKKLGIHFKDKALLREALTHRSYLNEHPRWASAHNERLEFLGDAVLELTVSEALFRRFPDFPEGQLTMLRAALVNYQMLAKVAGEIGLEGFVLMSRGEARDLGKAREVIVANAFEAVVGAIYLDQGLEASRAFVAHTVLPHTDEVMKTRAYKDPKSELQELMQEERRITPSYSVLEESGPAHRRRFRIGVYLEEEQIGEGEGASKQEAEVDAAKDALKRIGK
jgi:ribonuclease-3